MTLFFSLLPMMLLGNLHCFGMCGPLALMLGSHRTKYWYFLGRVVSFSLAGMLAGFFGFVINSQFSSLFSVFIGVVIVTISFFMFLGRDIPGLKLASQLLAPLNRRLSLFLLQDQAVATFLFGFFTVALPCGQTLLFFSACALYADALMGLLIGFSLAVLTSPSLFFAMKAQSFLNRFKQNTNMLMGSCGVLIGMLAVCRGMADLGWISHFVISETYHIVIY